MKKQLLLVFIMNSSLLLFGAEQIQCVKPYSLDKAIDNAWNKICSKYIVLREIEKLLPEDVSKNISQWLIRLCWNNQLKYRSLKISQDIFFRKLLSFCIVPSLQKEKEWGLTTCLSRTYDGAYYLQGRMNESKRYIRIYDTKSNVEIGMVAGEFEQNLTKKAVLIMRSDTCFFYDIVHDKKHDFGLWYGMKINNDETLVAGMRDRMLYVQKIPIFAADVDEIMNKDCVECESELSFIEFTSNDRLLVGFRNGSIQLFTIDMGSTDRLKAGTLYGDMVPQFPCVSRHRSIDGTDEYIINSDGMTRSKDSYGIRVKADGIQQQFFIKSTTVWDYLGEKTLLAVDAEQRRFVILDYTGKKICTGDKVAIGGSQYIRDVVSYIGYDEKEQWIAATLRVVRDDKGNGIGFKKTIMEEVMAVPGVGQTNKQGTLMLAPMREPKDSYAYGCYDFAGNKLAFLNNVKDVFFHPNGCSILYKNLDDAKKKVSLYPKEKKIHFKRLVQDCKISQCFVLAALCDEASKL